jgi:hypothetical protein
MEDIVKEMYNNQLYSDLHIKLKSGDIFYAHKLIVCNKSDMIKALTSNGMSETTSEYISFDIPDNILTTTMYIIYTGDLLLTDTQTDSDIIEIARFLHYLLVKEYILTSFIDIIIKKHLLSHTNQIALAYEYSDNDNLSHQLMKNVSLACFKKNHIDDTIYIFIINYYSKHSKQYNNIIYKRKILNLSIKYCISINKYDSLQTILNTFIPIHNTKHIIIKLYRKYQTFEYVAELLINKINLYPDNDCLCKSFIKSPHCKSCGYISCRYCKPRKECCRCYSNCPKCTVLIRVDKYVLCSECVIDCIINDRFDCFDFENNMIIPKIDFNPLLEHNSNSTNNKLHNDNLLVLFHEVYDNLIKKKLSEGILTDYVIGDK